MIRKGNEQSLFSLSLSESDGRNCGFLESCGILASEQIWKNKKPLSSFLKLQEVCTNKALDLKFAEILQIQFISVQYITNFAGTANSKYISGFNFKYKHLPVHLVSKHIGDLNYKYKYWHVTFFKCLDQLLIKILQQVRTHMSIHELNYQCTWVICVSLIYNIHTVILFSSTNNSKSCFYILGFIFNYYLS